jgi:hypothetical protein
MDASRAGNKPDRLSLSSVSSYLLIAGQQGLQGFGGVRPEIKHLS